MLAKWDGEDIEAEVACLALSTAARAVVTLPETLAQFLAAMAGRRRRR